MAIEGRIANAGDVKPVLVPRFMRNFDVGLRAHLRDSRLARVSKRESHMSPFATH